MIMLPSLHPLRFKYFAKHSYCIQTIILFIYKQGKLDTIQMAYKNQIIEMAEKCNNAEAIRNMNIIR